MTSIVQSYSNVAFLYDAWTWLTERKSLGVALSRAAIRDGETVLEIAVGTGVLFREILRANPSGRSVGIDLTEAMLRRARRKAERTHAPFELAIGDARALGFPDGAFDLVVNNNMLGLLPEREIGPVLREIFRVLRPGGRVVLVTMMRPQKRLGAWIYRIGAVWLGGWREIVLEPIVRRAGFEDIRAEIVTQAQVPSEVLSARKPLT